MITEQTKKEEIIYSPGQRSSSGARLVFAVPGRIFKFFNKWRKIRGKLAIGRRKGIFAS